MPPIKAKHARATRPGRSHKKVSNHLERDKTTDHDGIEVKRDAMHKELQHSGQEGGCGCSRGYGLTCLCCSQTLGSSMTRAGPGGHTQQVVDGQGYGRS